MSQKQRISIGGMAQAAGVNIETIRFYQRKGLLAIPSRQHGEIRRYELKDIARVRFVKAAQRLGFSLEEIAGLLKLDDGAHCDAARRMAEHKLSDVRAKLVDLHRIESALGSLVADCCSTKGTVKCPLISALRN